jgi:pimeloyl-ACP methyl ester carboxylesterase
MPHAIADRPVTAAAPSAAQVLASFRGPPQRFIDVGHSRLAYRRFGSGPDVVFVHGWPLHSATYRHLIPLLADSMTCHLLDLPGTGQTEWDDDAPIGLVAHAQTVRRAVDALGLSRYAIIAHDSGGAIARILAADDDRVSALALGNTEIPGHTPALVVFFGLMLRMPGGAALFRTLLARPSFLRSNLGFGGCFDDPRYVDGEFRELFVAPLLSSRRAFRGQLGLLGSLHELENLQAINEQIRVPVRLIWGARDKFFPLAGARDMVAQFGGTADLVAIESGKLFAHEDFAEQFADAVSGLVG